MANTGAPLNLEYLETGERSPELTFRAAMDILNEFAGQVAAIDGSNFDNEAAAAFRAKLGIGNFTATKDSGLSLLIDPGRLQTESGVLTYEGGTVTVNDDTTSYVVFDLFTQSLRVLPRAYHHGAVLVATVVAAAGAITSVTQPSSFDLPSSRIERTKRKILNHEKVRIAIVGDSLLFDTRWPTLLFDDATADDGYNLANLDNITLHNYAQGGMRSDWGLLWLGKAVTTATPARTYDNTSVIFGPSGDLYHNEGANGLRYSPIAQGNYDLVIVGFGANENAYKWIHYDALVRLLRMSGAEVLIISQSPRDSDHEFHKTEIDNLLQLCESYGCALADTWAYVNQSFRDGVEPLVDGVHQNSVGNGLYAAAIRSVLNDVPQRAENNPLNPYRVLHWVYDDLSHEGGFVGGQVNTKCPSFVDFEPFTNDTTTGSVGAIGPADALKNPAYALTGSTSMVSLTAGQWAQGSHPFCFGFDLVCNVNRPFSVDVYRDNGIKIGTLTNTAGDASSVVIGTFRGLLFDQVGINLSTPDTSSFDTGLSGLRSLSIKLEGVSGQLDLAGFSFYAWPNQEIPFSAMTFKGTWAEEAGNYGGLQRWSDTTNDSLTFDYEGTGCVLLFPSWNTSGVVRVWLDGKQVGDFDLYTPGGYTQPIYVFPLAAENEFQRGYGRHTVHAKLISVGGSASGHSPAAGTRRFALSAAYALDSR